MRATFEKYVLHFKKPAGTSRGYLASKTSYFVKIFDDQTGKSGIGECSLLPGLSPDDVPEIESVINDSIVEFNKQGAIDIPHSYPALRFAWESTIIDHNNGGKGILFESDFTRGEKSIEVNGLIWMGSPEEMVQQVAEKVAKDFHCIKFKIGALDFESELEILKEVRKRYGNSIEIRLDANGAFAITDAIESLEKLSEFDVHSIEQPISQGQWKDMAVLCRNSPIPIALDEELISVQDNDRARLLDEIKPQYLILKPSLLGGFAASDEWIRLCEERGIGWWATSALESNVGLSVIAQWVGAKDISVPQGLGTGGLFTNNTPAKTEIRQSRMYFTGQA